MIFLCALSLLFTLVAGNCPVLMRPAFDAPGCSWVVVKNKDGCDAFEFRCIPGVDTQCYQAVGRGTCEALIRRYFFSPKVGRCLYFLYGGCGGNSNNFATQAECESVCFPGTSLDPNAVSKCATVRCAKCYKCNPKSGGCVRDTTQEGCEPRNPCDAVRCGTCNECRLNKLRQPKCVHKSGCCADGKPPSVNCFVDPCQFADEACAQSEHCISDYCKGCDAIYYDSLWNHIPNNQCRRKPPPTPDTSPCATVNCGRCNICVPTKRLCKKEPCVQYICQPDPDCARSGTEPKTTCANVDCMPDRVCKMINNEPKCVEDKGLTVATNSKLLKCSQLPDTGPCKARFVRYHYDRVHSECRSFVYGGCMGNGNNYRSKIGCEKACNGTDSCPIYKLPPPKEGCEYEYKLDKATLCPRPTLFCPNNNTKPGECPAARSGKFGTCQAECRQDDDCKGDHKCCTNGCGVGACVAPKQTNAEPSLAVQRRCRQPMDTGPCEAAIDRWYFDHYSASCKAFKYGGCQGNSNNFISEQFCKNICDGVPPCPIPGLTPPPAGCTWEKVPANNGCPVYRLKCDTNPCAVTLCLVNTTCQVHNGQAVCVPIGDTPPRCLQPKVVGPCKAAIRSWYYDDESETCQEFIYGGCRGNQNRFRSEEACKRVCVEKKKCQPPPLPRPPKGCSYRAEDGPDGCPVYRLICDEKPGNCPVPPPNTGGICVESCSEDNDCDGFQKCCSKGCGHTCVLPRRPCRLAPIPAPPEGCRYETSTGSDGCPKYKLICNMTVEPEFDPCDPNPCTPCEKCKAIPRRCIRAPCPQYDCLGGCDKCETCTKSGHCISGRFENCSEDPCSDALCPSQPNALCERHPCDCRKPQFYVQPGGMKFVLSEDDCHRKN